MRCLACNKNLNDYESTVKTESGHYVDLCRRCYSTIEKDLPAQGNPALLHEYDNDIEEEENSFDEGLDTEDGG